MTIAQHYCFLKLPLAIYTDTSHILKKQTIFLFLKSEYSDKIIHTHIICNPWGSRHGSHIQIAVDYNNIKTKTAR